MNDLLSHSARVLRSLALTSTMLLPACSSSDPDPQPTKVPASAEPEQPAPAPAPVASASSSTTDDAGGGDAEPAQGDGGKISGPLPPPELPKGFA